MSAVWLITDQRRRAVAVEEIPVADYSEFYEEMSVVLGQERYHCANYFGVRERDELRFYCVMLDDEAGTVMLTSWKQDYYSEQEIRSLAAVHPSMHPFEREITENFLVEFRDSPYDKPLRFAYNRADKSKTIENYPFYFIGGHSLHEVNVGPIHAGIIEPGAFRFICNGERILHMEVVLGYQHRGVESLMASETNRLRQAVMSENIAGDSAVSHSAAYCMLVEAAEGFDNEDLHRERAIGQELERIAMHIADTGALCMDVGYQLGQVACEALRTVVINTTQLWCGNRFGKSLLRPFGTNYPLTEELKVIISHNIRDVKGRYDEVCRDMFTSPSVLSRFEDCCAVSRRQMSETGAVGPVAKASGLGRDLRRTHGYGPYKNMIDHNPSVINSGDVMARALVRYKEVLQSADYVLKLLRAESENPLPKPRYDQTLPPSTLFFSLVEGWRGEICHSAVTDEQGEISCYKVKDPSLHNWYGLSIAVRGADISDFPVCNKSFNLSYCGHDL